MKMIYVWMMLSIVLMNQACREKENIGCHKSIKFNNKSNKDLYVMPNYEYPDTMAFVYSPNPILDPTHNLISSKEVNDKALWQRDCWEDIYQSYIQSDTLMVYIFDAQVLDNTPWDSIISQHNILERYDLSLQDLDNMNWTITYP